MFWEFNQGCGAFPFAFSKGSSEWSGKKPDGVHMGTETLSGLEKGCRRVDRIREVGVVLRTELYADQCLPHSCLTNLSIHAHVHTPNKFHHTHTQGFAWQISTQACVWVKLLATFSNSFLLWGFSSFSVSA